MSSPPTTTFGSRAGKFQAATIVTTPLQERWNDLYKTRLPALARERNTSQPKWPVSLDHCFARIILDNAVGQDRPWTEVLGSPAYKNMTETQLREAIELGERIAHGAADLVELDERSLELRGKASKTGQGIKRKAADDGGRVGGTKVKNGRKNDGAKRRRDGKVSSYFMPSPASEGTEDLDDMAEGQSTTVSQPMASPARDRPARRTPHADKGDEGSKHDTAATVLRNPISGETYPANTAPLELIAQAKQLTAFRKRVLSLLTQVPRGRYTTYQALAEHVSGDPSYTSGKTCARAVGSAMRNNPFAPVVPCHRVLASDRRIGGFGGHWGEEGRYAADKKAMLREEGVRFDGKGKVVGEPFRGFQ